MAEEYFGKNGKLSTDILTYLSGFLIDVNDIAHFRQMNKRTAKAAAITQLRHRIQHRSRNKRHLTILQYAARRNDIELVRTILNQPECTPEFIDAAGKTALMIAAEENHIAIVELLIQNGANQNLFDNVGRTALVYAIARGHVTLSKLLANNTDNVHLNIALLNRHTISYPARINQEILSFLLDKGASFFSFNPNPNIAFWSDIRALRWLSEIGENYELIKTILSKDRFIDTASEAFIEGFEQHRPSGGALQFSEKHKQLIFYYITLAAIFKGNDSEVAKQYAYNFLLESGARPYFDDAINALLDCKNPAFFSENNKAQLRLLRFSSTQVPTPFNNFHAALRKAINACSYKSFPYYRFDRYNLLINSPYQERYHEHLIAIYDLAENLALNPGDVNQQHSTFSTCKNIINDLFICETSREKAKYVATNLAIAITVIGLIILAIKALYSYYHTKRFLLFNHPTANVAKELAQLERAIPHTNLRMEGVESTRVSRRAET